MLVHAAPSPSYPSFQAENSRSSSLTEEQKQILDRIREYSTTYVSNLPNFVCVQITQQLLGNNRDHELKPIGEYRQRLNYINGHETYEPIDSHRVGKLFRRPGSLHAYSKGEFGTLMQQVLATDKATFIWLRWDTIAGTRAAVFGYRVDLAHTTMRIQNGSESAMTAYHGMVFANPEDGTVLRITSESEGIPRTFELQRAGNEVDYGQVTIAGKNYLLPTLSIFSGVSRSGPFRNEAQFIEYQKFGAESKLKVEPQ